jgi:hypothetical protein
MHVTRADRTYDDIVAAAAQSKAVSSKTAEVTREIRRWIVKNKPCTFSGSDLMPMEWPAGLE